MSGGRPRRLGRFQLRQFPLHLDDQRRQLFLTLLAGVNVDIAGVFLTVDPFG